jgi:hypothetical protein
MDDMKLQTTAQPTEEPGPAELSRSRDVLEARLLAEVRAFENRYELPSADLDGALQRGDIRETAEIAQWVIAYRTLRGLADEQQARR